MRSLKAIFFLLMLSATSLAQEKILQLDQYMSYVKKYHPVAVQANLVLEQGEREVLKSKGGFDPYIYGSTNQKSFEDKNYFNYVNAGLKIPTWYGIEVKSEYDRSSGIYINPEDNLPPGGLLLAGVSVNVGKGLVIDKRRAVVKQANLFKEATISERKIMLNQLYFDAVKMYWKWVEAWNQYKVYEESVVLATDRFTAVKQSFNFGDKPAIDTLEAFIQVQNRRLGMNQYYLKFQNMTLEASNFLWFENNTPLEITDDLVPPLYETLTLVNAVALDSVNSMIQSLDQRHPELLLNANKLQSLEVERRLKAEALKPTLRLNYNALNRPVGSFAENFSSQNYKFGVDFGIPVLLRRERGELQLTKIKMESNQLTQAQKQLMLENKVYSYYNAQQNLSDQIEISQATVENYKRLLEGEKQKFDSGESSLFLVNRREIRLIQSQLKLVELFAKYNIASVGIQWSSGTLYQR